MDAAVFGEGCGVEGGGAEEAVFEEGVGFVAIDEGDAWGHGGWAGGFAGEGTEEVLGGAVGVAAEAGGAAFGGEGAACERGIACECAGAGLREVWRSDFDERDGDASACGHGSAEGGFEAEEAAGGFRSGEETGGEREEQGRDEGVAEHGDSGYMKGGWDGMKIGLGRVLVRRGSGWQSAG